MKKLIVSVFAIFAFATASKAQYIEEGREFYDSSKTKMKEVYHYFLRYSMSVNYENGGDTVINPQPIVIRHGSCIQYRTDGTIELVGEYSHGKRTGKWKFYDAKGKTIVREENY